MAGHRPREAGSVALPCLRLGSCSDGLVRLLQQPPDVPPDPLGLPDPRREGLAAAGLQLPLQQGHHQLEPVHCQHRH